MMYEHNALGYWSGLALCLTKVRSSRARCPATALICTCQNIDKKRTLKKTWELFSEMDFAPATMFNQKKAFLYAF